jgi:hypothetical protein
MKMMRTGGALDRGRLGIILYRKKGRAQAGRLYRPSQAIARHNGLRDMIPHPYPRGH